MTNATEPEIRQKRKWTRRKPPEERKKRDSKLTDGNVEHIITLLKAEVQPHAVARAYHVSISTLERAVKKAGWRWRTTTVLERIDG